MKLIYSDEWVEIFNKYPQFDNEQRVQYYKRIGDLTGKSPASDKKILLKIKIQD